MNDLVGYTLGQYRIVDKIGEGGMAMVFRAYQPGLNRYVALKVLPPIHAKQPGFSERFQREAEAVANLNHPNILPVFDYGQQEGYSYIAMRYVEGARTLKEVMIDRLSPRRVADLIAQIAAALDCAHRQGIVHRDVKPANVLMDGEWALLTDFGLARMTEASVKLTGSGVGVGTPAYMSPEQGQGIEIDQRSDIYSLGVILFEMLTGQIPHDAETPFAIVLKRVTEPLPMPRAVNPEIPEPVERVILKALAREPQDRFASAGAMATALQQAVNDVAGAEAGGPALGLLGMKGKHFPAAERRADALPRDQDESPPAAREGIVVVQRGGAPSASAKAEKKSVPTGRVVPWKWVAGIGTIAVVAVLLVWGLTSGFIRIGRPAVVPTIGPATSPKAAMAIPATPTAPAATETPALTPTSTPLLLATETPRPAPTDTPAPTPTSTPAQVVTLAATPVVYVVRKGDTLLAIALRHGVSVDALVQANDLSGESLLRPGDKLIIPVAGSQRLRERDGATIVYVPAGEFWMGSDDPDAEDKERPKHQIALDAFWIDRVEVTNARYRQCVDAGACSPPGGPGSCSRDRYYDNSDFDDYPVVEVTWYQARAYAEWVGGRLPTEAEWEYAAQGPGGSLYPWGNDPPKPSLLNYDNVLGDTTRVGSYPDGVSWCGALDMAGNVWEWTQGLYKEYPYGSEYGREDPGVSGYRVVRGGSFGDGWLGVRATYRHEYSSEESHCSKGFRVVVPISP